MLLTKLLVKEYGWHVSSVIRDPSQRDEILELGKGQRGKVHVLVDSLEEVRSVEQAKHILNLVSPNYVVFSAGKNMSSKDPWWEVYFVSDPRSRCWW